MSFRLAILGILSIYVVGCQNEIRDVNTFSEEETAHAIAQAYSSALDTRAELTLIEQLLEDKLEGKDVSLEDLRGAVERATYSGLDSILSKLPRTFEYAKLHRVLDVLSGGTPEGVKSLSIYVSADALRGATDSVEELGAESSFLPFSMWLQGCLTIGSPDVSQEDIEALLEKLAMYKGQVAKAIAELGQRVD